MEMFWDEFKTRMVACTKLDEEVLRPLLQRQMRKSICMKEDMDKWEEEDVWMDMSITADPATSTRNPAASSQALFKLIERHHGRRRRRRGLDKEIRWVADKERELKADAIRRFGGDSPFTNTHALAADGKQRKDRKGKGKDAKGKGEKGKSKDKEGKGKGAASHGFKTPENREA